MGRPDLHGLHGQGNAKHGAADHVEDAREHQGRRQVDGALQREGDHQRQQRAEIAEGARDLGRGRLPERAEVAPVAPGELREDGLPHLVMSAELSVE